MTQLTNTYPNAAARCLVDILNEPDAFKLQWQAQGGLPGRFNPQKGFCAAQENELLEDVQQVSHAVTVAGSTMIIRSGLPLQSSSGQHLGMHCRC